MSSRRAFRAGALSLLVCVALARSAGADGSPADEPAAMPYATPRETLVPGNPGMPGGFHLMINGSAYAANPGLGGYTIANEGVRAYGGGATRPLLTNDWAMAYGRDERGWVEGPLMLNFEPFTVGSAGYPEIGQSGEGLWDAQHAHQLLHKAMVALHPLSALEGCHPRSMMEEGEMDLSLFAGQGSATIGPPIFMHRASSPGPTVPRKHHKGENPHETFPVLGAALRWHDTWLEASAFSARELTPEDSRFRPYIAAPASFAARVRHTFGHWLEAQVSPERLRDQAADEPDAYQVSASLYAYGDVARHRVDALLDWAIDAPDAVGGGPRHTAQAALAELAVRTPSRRDVVWLRSEVNQREEAERDGGGVSSPWLFETLGFDHVVLGGTRSGVQLGLFAEGTLVSIPSSLQPRYGTDVAGTLLAGVHVFGMWMLDGAGRRMHHGT